MSAPQQLPPINPPLGIFPQLCAPSQTTLVLREKLWSVTSDKFSIKDLNGTAILGCHGSNLSFTQHKTFTDAQGNALFDLRMRPFHLHTTFEAEIPDGTVLFTCKSKLMSFGGSKMTCSFTNRSDGRPVELYIEGDWLDRKATVTMDGAPVAQIGRDLFNAAQIFGGQQTYFVSVAGGVDLALIAALCICLDEKANEGNETRF